MKRVVLLLMMAAMGVRGQALMLDEVLRSVEANYPPLLATLLLDLVARNSDRRVTSFKFRALSPTFDVTPFAVCGMPGADGKVALWAQHQTGALAMEAEATLG